MKLWAGKHTTSAATEIISDVLSLLVMYAAAGFGWIIFLAIPPVVATFLSVVAQTRVKTLRASQQEIVNEWGPEVANVNGTDVIEDVPNLDQP